MTSEITPVILSGGSGTRLWPLSLPAAPKQLHALVGDDTLIQATATRSVGIAGVTAPVVVCNAAQAGVIGTQLGAAGAAPKAVVVEPAARNTAPAVAAAALLLDADTVMAVFPADHVIADSEAFRAALVSAVEAAGDDRIVTFGIVPTRPETGFGYIEYDGTGGGPTPVLRFVEKPDAATAAGYVASGRFLWNSGMFVFTAGSILEEMRRHVPAVVESVNEAVAAADGHGDEVTLSPAFEASPSISIDHAVMERTDRAVVVPLDAGWSDVGSWQALWEVAAPSGETVTHGPVLAVDVARSYLRAESKPLAVIGLEDVVVVETEDAVLVMDRGRAQDVRMAAEWFAGLGPDVEPGA